VPEITHESRNGYGVGVFVLIVSLAVKIEDVVTSEEIDV